MQGVSFRALVRVRARVRVRACVRVRMRVRVRVCVPLCPCLCPCRCMCRCVCVFSRSPTRALQSIKRVNNDIDIKAQDTCFIVDGRIQIPLVRGVCV